MSAGDLWPEVAGAAYVAKSLDTSEMWPATIASFPNPSGEALKTSLQVHIIIKTLVGGSEIFNSPIFIIPQDHVTANIYFSKLLCPQEHEFVCYVPIGFCQRVTVI